MGNTVSITEYRRDNIHSARQLAIELDPLFGTRQERATCYERFISKYSSDSKPYGIVYNETRTIDLSISEKQRYKNLYIYNIDYDIPNKDIGMTMYNIKVHSPNVKMLVRVRYHTGYFGEYGKIDDLLIDGINHTYRLYPGISFVFISNTEIPEITISYDSDIVYRWCERGGERGLPYVLNYPPPPRNGVGPKYEYKGNSYKSNYEEEVYEYYEDCIREFSLVN